MYDVVPTVRKESIQQLLLAVADVYRQHLPAEGQHIPSTVDMLQKQIMRLFQDVLDVDGNKKKPVSEKLQAYLEKEKTHLLYAYKFRLSSTVYEQVGKGSFVETLHPTSIYNLIEFALRECVKREQRMRICSYCTAIRRSSAL